MTEKQRWVLVLTSIASLMVALDVTVVSTALSTIRLHLNASIDQLEWIPWTGTVFIIAPISGALADKIGDRPLIVTGLLMQAAGFAWVAVIARTGLPYSHMIAPLLLAGAGISTAVPAAQNSVISAVSPEAIGKASGTQSMMRQLAGALGSRLR